MEYLEEKFSKSIIVDGDLHTKLKVFCRGKNLKIGAVIEDLIKLYITQPKEVQEMIDQIKK